MHAHIDPNSPLGRVMWILGIPLYGGLLWFELRSFYRAFSSRDWPVADGEIEQSRVDKVATIHGVHKQAKVQYVYTVDGEQRSGKVIAFGLYNQFVGRGSARKTSERYPKGKHVQVYYHRDEPGLCCLEPGWPGFVELFFLLISVPGVVLSCFETAKTISRLL